MNRRLNGFIKKPHIFIDNQGRWVFNVSIGCKQTDTVSAKRFCKRINRKEQ